MSNHSATANAAARADPAAEDGSVTRFSQWLPVSIFLVIAVAIVGIGLQWIERHKTVARRDAQAALQAVTQLKATQVESWRAGIEHAAQMLARDPLVEEALAAPSAQRMSVLLTRDRIEPLLDSHRRNAGITGLTLLDGRGNVLAAIGVQAPGQEQRLRALALAGMDSGHLLWDDIHAGASLREVATNVVVPISESRHASPRAAYALIVHVDPARFLFPFIQHWPTPSDTAETFLFRREGDQVVYLNTLRHRNLRPLSLRFSAADERLLAAQALRGERGALEGRDYRGAHVVGYALRITGSPWFLIAKIDARELYAPIERTAGAVAFAAGAVLIAFALAIHLWWRRRADAHMRLYGAVFETTREAVIITDADQRIVAINPAFSKITGYAAGEVIGQTPRVLSSGRQDADFYQRMWHSLSACGNWAGEIWNRRKDGSVYPQWQSMSEVRDRRGYVTHYVAIFSDISERKSAEARISFLAYHDALTGLPNRALLRDRMSQALSAAQRSGQCVAVMLIDLDRFKNINDTLGHSVGDELLRGVAARIQTALRGNDTVCRIGGDEFVILLPTVDAAEEAAAVAQRVIGVVAEPLAVNQHEIHVTLSIGVCVYPSDAADVDGLLRCADTAMYQAKEQGRNGYRFFTPARASILSDEPGSANQVRSCRRLNAASA